MNLRSKKILLDYELKMLVDQLGVATIGKIPQEGKCTITSVNDRKGRVTYHFVASDILEFILSSGENPSVLPTEFGIFIDMPDEIVAGTEENIAMTIKPVEVGGEGFNKVMFTFNTVCPSEDAIVTYKATDSTGKEYTFTNQGTWGPESGFDMPADYEATTDWKVTFSQPGEYMVGFNLVSVEDKSVLLSSSKTVVVSQE